MARPLRYDDQFVSIVNDRIFIDFLCIFRIKAQSTCFYKSMNLQRGLIVCGLYDLIVGSLVLFYFIELASLVPNNFLDIIENGCLVAGILFAILAFEGAVNLKKQLVYYYKLYRNFITFFIPLCEIYLSPSGVCFYLPCDFLTLLCLMSIYLIVNLYLNKIVASFYARLLFNQELLIIHGKHLEKMMEQETYKIYSNASRYIPPDKMSNKEKEFIQLSSLGFKIEEDTFEPGKNPFLKAMKNLKM
jgi:hypothetical protein